jgi:hypothetical protein
MPAIEFKCPEKGCDVMTQVWVPNYPQHDSEHNADAACKKHKKKYEEIRKNHIEQCKLWGIRP